MKAISEYLSSKIKVSNRPYDIDDINKLLFDTFNIKLTNTKTTEQFDEITYCYEFSEDMYNLFRDYYVNVKSKKLNQELHDYTDLDESLKFEINNLNSSPCNAYCCEVTTSSSRREIFVNCIDYDKRYGDDSKIIMIIKTDSDLDLHDNAYIMLKYLIDQSIR